MAIAGHYINLSGNTLTKHVMVDKLRFILHLISVFKIKIMD